MTAPFRIGRTADRREADAGNRWHAPGLLAGLLAAGRPGGAERPSTRRAFWVMSNLRLDLDPAVGLPDPPPDFDAVLVAGGVAEGLPEAMRLLASALGDRARGKPVIVVPGNVEFRSRVPLVQALARGRDVAAELGLILLSDDAVRFGPPRGDGTVVIGATLWTDWELGSSPGGARARVAARTAWEDARRIALRPGRMLTPLDTLALHARSRAFIEDALTSVVIASLGLPRGPNACIGCALPGDAAVVVTCHAPTPRSLPRTWEGWHADAWLPASLASEAAAAVHAWGAPRLWVHGVVPGPADHVLGKTRIVANPRFDGTRRAAFDPAVVVSV